jgi:hypothetical protein
MRRQRQALLIDAARYHMHGKFQNDFQPEHPSKKDNT